MAAMYILLLPTIYKYKKNHRQFVLDLFRKDRFKYFLWQKTEFDNYLLENNAKELYIASFQVFAQQIKCVGLLSFILRIKYMSFTLKKSFRSICEEILCLHKAKFDKNACACEYVGKKRSAVKRRLAIFAGFSGDCLISESCLYYVKELLTVVDNIIFVMDNPLMPGEIDKIKPYVLYAKAIRHETYDFGSYKSGFVYAERNGFLNDVDELVICNDSCYGPIYSLDKVFLTMDKEVCDFWGITSSNDINYHLQSYFFVFKSKVFLSSVFAEFVHKFTKQDCFFDYVNKYEIAFTKRLMDFGYIGKSYIRLPQEVIEEHLKVSGCENPTIFPVSLIQEGSPFIKKKVFTGGFSNDLYESPCVALEKINEINPTLHSIMVDELANSKPIDDRWLNYAELIKNFDVISFDIFDTLLIRPYKKPTDLFKHIETIYNIPSFYTKRIAAEAKARAVYADCEEITLDQIYEQIDIQDKEQVKELELDVEKKLLKKNSVIFKIYQEALAQGKKVIAISDMYLSKAFLREVLNNNGYAGIDDIYVSSEEKCCKYNSKLFVSVIKRLGIAPEKIVHFGDNINSDKKAANAVGIRGVFLPSLIDSLCISPANQKFSAYAQVNSLTASIILGLVAQFRADHNSVDRFYDFGYVFGGPLAVGYCQFIHKQCISNDIDNILFVSRDGYALREVYNIINENPIRNFYIYASRAIITKTMMVTDVHDTYAEKMLSQMNAYDSFLPNSKLSEKELLEKVQDYVRCNRKEYFDYIESLGIDGSRLASVDMTTGRFSSLKFFKNIFADRYALGVFTMALAKTEENYVTYSGRLHTIKDLPYIELLEELITSPESQIVSIKNCKPIYEDWNIIEMNRGKIYRKILAGILHFARDYRDTFGGFEVDLPFDDISYLINSHIRHLNISDLYILKAMYHNYDSAGLIYNTCYESIFREEENKERERMKKKKRC